MAEAVFQDPRAVRFPESLIVSPYVVEARMEKVMGTRVEVQIEGVVVVGLEVVVRVDVVRVVGWLVVVGLAVEVEELVEVIDSPVREGQIPDPVNLAKG